MHDFERALINSVGKWFKCEHHLGCFFHWKQALRKNMVDKGFITDVIALILPLFDFLTVIKKEDMTKAVEYIRSKVLDDKRVKRCHKKLFEEYLDEYFRKTWLSNVMVDMFNYNDGENWRKEMQVWQ